MEQASVEACNVMNWLGYGPHVRQARRDVYREYNKLLDKSRTVTCITTGSKAEGLTRYTESDHDMMLVLEDVMCLENGAHCDTIPRETTVFTLNTDMCYHGHCRLFLERFGSKIHTFVINSLCYYENERALLSSDLYVNVYDGRKLRPGVVGHERAGPSIPSTVLWIMHYDHVPSLHCDCPSILQRWAQRRRYWPPPDVVHKVEAIGAFVTPVGFKNSEYKHVEWRICFNTGENELMSSLHNTQVYMYVILKMVVKDVLKPLKKELTSYTVKNIVLWIAEKYPQGLFNERTLLHWVGEGLVELRTAILTKHLPYYMIPERNLMEGCGMDEEQGRTWVKTLTDMIDEGQNMLLRLPTIRQAIISHPEPLLWFCNKRIEVELLCLKGIIRIKQCTDEKGSIKWSDAMIQATERRYAEILREVHQRMCWDGSRVYNAIEILQSMLM